MERIPERIDIIGKNRIQLTKEIEFYRSKCFMLIDFIKSFNEKGIPITDKQELLAHSLDYMMRSDKLLRELGQIK